MQRRIYYHDTDCGGVVYYANYLKFLEEARTDWFESRGLSVAALMAQGIVFVVSRQEIDYLAPARYGDTVTIVPAVTAISRLRLTFEYELTNQDGLRLARAKTVLACVDAGLKPRAIPDAVRSATGLPR